MMRKTIIKYYFQGVWMLAVFRVDCAKLCLSKLISNILFGSVKAPGRMEEKNIQFIYKYTNK